METKHTPGPWYAYEYLAADNIPQWRVGCDTCGDALPLAEVYDRKGLSTGYGGIFREIKANAHLMAAAHELLEALEYNHAFLLAIHTIELDKNKREAIADLMDKNSATIAKAKAGAS